MYTYVSVLCLSRREDRRRSRTTVLLRLSCSNGFDELKRVYVHADHVSKHYTCIGHDETYASFVKLIMYLSVKNNSVKFINVKQRFNK